MRRFRSAYYVQDHLPRRERMAPAPLVIYNGWTDDIMPPGEALRYYERGRDALPGARSGPGLGGGFAHPRGSLAAQPPIADEPAAALFDRYLMGDATAAA